MSNYTKTTNFAAKDSLPSGNAAKIVKGTEIDTEFNNIETASATKADSNNSTLTGTTAFETLSDGTISITAFVDEDNMASDSAALVPTQQSVKAYVDSQVTAQDLDFQADTGGALSIDLDSETLTLTGGTGVDTSGSGNAVTFAIDSTVATLAGTQTLTNKTLTSPTLNTPTIGTSFTIGSATITEAELEILDGATVTTAELNVLDGITSTTAELNILDGVTSTAAELNILDGVTSTAAELNILDGVTSTTAELNILDGVTSTASELNILDGVTSTAAELNILDGVTATTAEINYVDGVTSNVQTQLNTKAPIDGATFTGTTTIPTADINGGAIDGTVIGGSSAAAGSFTTLGASGAITGTLGTAAQTNITSVGTLGSLTVSGDVTVDTNSLKVDSTNNRVGILNASPDVTLDIGSATDSIHIPVGTTAQRPGSPAAGYFRYNSTLSQFEGYTDAWGAIGGGGGSNLVVDTMTGDGSDTTLTLSNDPLNENNTQVYIDGVYQNKDTYSVSGTTLTFSTAPPSGSAVEAMTIQPTAVNVPADASVTSAKLSGDLVTPGALEVTGTVTATGTSVFASLDISGDIDVDGTTNLDVVDIDGAVDMASTLGVTGAATFSSSININSASYDNRQVGVDGGGFFIYNLADSRYDLQISDIGGLSTSPAAGGNAVFNEGGVDADFRVESDGNTHMLFVDAGNNRVGMGTSSPDTPLDVQGAIQASESGGDFIRMQTDGTNNIFDVNSGAYVFRTSGFEERMRIDSSGQVKVGTTGPTWDSTFRSFVTKGGFLASQSTSYNYVGGQTYYNGAFKRLNANAAELYEQSFGNHIFYSAISGAADSTITWDERLRIDSSGKLTLGFSYGVAADPDGSGGFGAGYNFETNSGSPRHLVTGPVTGQYLSSGSSPHIAWFTGTSAGAGTAAPERMRIDSSGRLMVNQTSVSAASAGDKMQVADGILTTGSLAGYFWENRSGMTIASQSGWGGWYSTGTASHFLYSDGANRASIGRTSGTYTALSDVNKKKDFEDSTVGLAAIMQLQPKKFRMLDDADDAPKYLGFVAQDVESVIPEAYVEDTSVDAGGVENTFIGLTDRPFIAALVKAIQEQQATIESQAAAITDLTTRLTALENN